MSWYHSAEAQQLLAAIKRERPDAWYLTRWAWVSTKYPKFKGENARKLRTLWEEHKIAAQTANDRELYSEINAAHPDDVIDEMLFGRPVPVGNCVIGAQLTECVGDPLLKRRAA